MNEAEYFRSELSQLRRLGTVALIEGATLILLVGIAVPLKYLGGWPLGTRLLGPVHGLAFIAYMFTVFQTAGGGEWTRAEIARLLGAAFVPFGGLFNMRLLAHKAQALRERIAAMGPGIVHSDQLEVIS